MGNISNVIPAKAGNAYTYDSVGNRLDMTVTNNLNQYTAAGTTSFYYDASGNMYRDGNYYYSYDPENRLTQVEKPDPPKQYLNSLSAYTKGGDAPWVADAYGFAKSGAIDNDQESRLPRSARNDMMYIDVQGPGTVEFQWKVSSQPGSDYLEFYLDGAFQSGLSGEHTWEPKSYTLTASGSHRLKWRYVKDSDDYDNDDCGYVKSVTWQPDPPAPTLAQALDSFLTYTTGGSANWQPKCWGETSDYAQSGTIGASQESWLATSVSGAGTFSFQWTVSSQEDYDYLEFYLDNVLQDAISGEVEGQQKSYTITGSGTHTLKWRYVKDSSDSGGNDRGDVDHVVWTGVIPNDPASDAWQKTLSYVYDAFGRRIEKKYDDLTVLKYVYDGDHCIAEYDAYNHVRRKYIYGPGVDQPICLIESTSTYAGTYYYHCDGLGSVAALTNSSGTTVEVYEYDVYGRVGASVPAHPNRIMFTGREYDQETGLYYYRARVYNPQIGRFLQTDPIGYGDGMNIYKYCRNNPVSLVDPVGLSPDPISIAFYDGSEEGMSFENAADDMDYYFDMSQCPLGMSITWWIEQKLLEVKDKLGSDWDKVAGVYSMDHSWNGSTSITDLEFGREKFSLTDPNDHRMEDLCKMLDRTLPANAMVHMRHCDLGREKNAWALENIAKWTNRTVTAACGHVDYGKEEVWARNPDGSPQHNLPDYTSAWGYVMAIPMTSPYSPSDKTVFRLPYVDHHDIPWRVY